MLKANENFNLENLKDYGFKLEETYIENSYIKCYNYELETKSGLYTIVIVPQTREVILRLFTDLVNVDEKKDSEISKTITHFIELGILKSVKE